MKTSIPHRGIHLCVNFIHNLLGKVHFLDRHLFSQVPVLGMVLQEAGFSLKILVAGERFNATGEYFKRGSTSAKKLVLGHQTLAEEFCIVSGEFYDLQCLINTLKR